MTKKRSETQQKRKSPRTASAKTAKPKAKTKTLKTTAKASKARESSKPAAARAKKKTTKVQATRKAGSAATNENQMPLRMTDDRRMRESGAAESGYHAPTRKDIRDLRKSHETASEPGVVNADEFIRNGSHTDALEGPEGIANLHPRKGPSATESRDFGMMEEEGETEDDSYPRPVTEEGQIFDDRKGWGAVRSTQGEGAFGEEGMEGPGEDDEILGETRKSA